MQDIKKDEVLEKIFADYFSGATQKTDLTNILSKAKKEKIRLHNRSLMRNFGYGLAATAAAIAIFVGMATDQNGLSTENITLSLSEMTASAVSYDYIEKNGYFSEEIKKLHASRNASVEYYKLEGKNRTAVKTEISYRYNGFYYFATLYVFTDDGLPLPEELKTHESLIGDEKYVDGEWISTFTAIDGGYRYCIDITSNKSNAIKLVSKYL